MADTPKLLAAEQVRADNPDALPHNAAFIRMVSVVTLLFLLWLFGRGLHDTYHVAYTVQSALGLPTPLFPYSAGTHGLLIVGFLAFTGLCFVGVWKNTLSSVALFWVCFAFALMLTVFQSLSIPSIGKNYEELTSHVAALERAKVPAELKAEVGLFLDTVQAKKDCRALRQLVMADYAKTGGDPEEHLWFLERSQFSCAPLLSVKDYLRRHNLTPTKPLYSLGQAS